ncbi:MAG: preprotein translocase subunit YajC [Desulfococcaceae bacterium]
MVDIVYAMGAPGGSAPGGAAGGFASLVPLILMFVIFYFLLIRPQQKKAKDHREMVNNLKKGDRIMTSGGILGQIVALDEETVSLEIADKVRIKVGRGYVASLTNQKSVQETNGKKDKLKTKE